jgi:hypothetical protein
MERGLGMTTVRQDSRSVTALAGCTLLAVLAGFGLSTFGPLLPCAAGAAIWRLAGQSVIGRRCCSPSGIGLLAGSVAYVALGLRLNAIGSPASGSGMGF